MAEITVCGISKPSVNLVDAGDCGSACFAVGREIIVNGTLLDGDEIEVPDIPLRDLISEAACNIMDSLGHRVGVRLEYDGSSSGFPGEAEAVANAAVQSAAGLVTKRAGHVYELMLEKSVRRKFFTVDEKVVSQDTLLKAACIEGLSYARLVSSFYGGYCVVKGGNIARRGEMESKLNLACYLDPRYEIYADDGVCDLLDRVIRSDMYRAAREYSLTRTSQATRESCSLLLGKGCFSSLADKGLLAGISWEEPEKQGISGEHHLLYPCNNPSTVSEKQRKIFKAKKFRRLNGSREYGSF